MALNLRKVLAARASIDRAYRDLAHPITPDDVALAIQEIELALTRLKEALNG